MYPRENAMLYIPLNHFVMVLENRCKILLRFSESLRRTATQKDFAAVFVYRCHNLFRYLETGSKFCTGFQKGL